LLTFCDQTACGEMAIFTTSSIICAFCVHATFCWWTEHSNLVLATLPSYTLFLDMWTTLICRRCTVSSQTRIGWRTNSFLDVL